MANEIFLKPKLKIVETEDSFEFHDEKLKMGKITARMLPILIGKNKYQSPGHGILDRLGLVEFKDDIDPVYKLRGAIAEKVVFDYMIESSRKVGVELTLKAFESEYKGSDGNYYGVDLFKNNKLFGGCIDIGIQAPEKLRAVVEVKSKDLSKYNDVLNEKNEYGLPIDEVLQGMHYCALMDLPRLVMAYVFFNESQMEILRKISSDESFDSHNIDVEKIIKDYNMNYENLTIELKRLSVDVEDIRTKQEHAYKLLLRAYQEKRIPKTLFKPSDIAFIQRYLNDGLPF